MEKTQTAKFGVLADGQEVFRHVISNGSGLELHVLNYGCIINKLIVPAASGKVDVVLGFDTVEDYVKAHSLPAPPYFGAVIGRYSGRINKGHLKLNSIDHQLNINNNSHTLHGGVTGFDQKIFRVTSLEESAITLEYVSRDGEEHFPGELHLSVRYSINDNNQVVIDYHAVSDKDTYVNVTQHSYFNLDGHKNDLSNQKLTIDAKNIIEIDQENIPTGKLIPAGEKEFDFMNPRAIPHKIDDSFIVENTQKPIATLESEQSHIKMTVISDQPSLHIYVGGNLFGQLKGKDGFEYHDYSGICFESQNYPDAPNQPDFPSALLRKDKSYRQLTSWNFEF